MSLRQYTPWPEYIARQYREAGLWAGKRLSDIVDDNARRYPERCALVDQHWEQRSFAELKTRVDQLACGLRQAGFSAGDIVVVQLPNRVEAIEVFFAAIKLGVIPVMALPAHRGSEIRNFCQQTNAKAYIGSDRHGTFDYQSMAASLLEDGAIKQVIIAGDITAPGLSKAHTLASLFINTVDAEQTDHNLTASDMALLQLSGGTTGIPKLIPRTHDDYFYSIRASVDVCHLTQHTVYLAALPLAHNFPLSSPGVLGTLWAGGCVVMADSGAPDLCFPLIAQYKVNITALVPPLAMVWLEAAARQRTQGKWTMGQSLQVLQVGGAKLSESAARRVKPVMGCQLQQVFGMAEGLVNYTRLDDTDDIVASTQGRPMSLYDELMVVDEHDQPVAPGHVGHLITRGPYTIRGYFGAEDCSKLQQNFTADGFYRTGDEVRLTPEGNIVVEGRSKDQINRGGEKIAAEEIENHLLAHPAIHDAAVVAMPDAFLGEKSCAFIITKSQVAEPVLPMRILAFLRSRQLADYKVPDRIELVDAFPQTRLGKVNKKQLRQMISDKLGLSA
jgi:2,3-dihydroxybenzoate-AMP ligase